MRAIQRNSESGAPFSNTGKKGKKSKNRDPRAAAFTQQRRNARRLPTRQMQRGR